MTLLIILFVLLVLGIGGIVYLLSVLREIESTNKKITEVQKRHYTLLRIAVPRQNTKSPLAAEQMFAALHGIYRKADVQQEHFTFEIAATSQSINFYMLVPTHLRDFIEGQIYSQYPTVEIEQASDYANISLEGKSMAGGEITLTKTDYYPIRTFTNFDVDPLAGITGVLSKIDAGELLAIQAALSPIDDSWQKEGLDYVKKIKEGKSVAPPPPLYKELSKASGTLVKEITAGVFSAVSGASGEKKEEKKEVKLSGPEEAALKGIESKVTKLGFAVTIRVIAITNDEFLSRTRAESVVGAFKQFNLSNLNGFTLGDVSSDASFLRTFRSRSEGSKPFRLNVEEIASVFHLPDSSVETPSISWAGSKKGEPPLNLPLEGEVDANLLTSFGLTSFRNKRAKFGIKQLDRLLHFYIIGKTGTGKSTLIENMIYDDIKEGRGVAVVDPHGELIDHIMNFIPEERINDVVYFSPDDREYPLAFNLLENVDPEMRPIVASGLMSIFTKLWANVWSARMEYILRNAILAALEVPNSTLLSIMRILNDPVYRKFALSHVTDPVVKDFFFNEYDKYDAKFRQEAIAPIQNKVGQFLSSSTIRNIVGQSKSTFNLSEIMDTGKIFLVDLSIGKIGEDNSKLLGSMMITKIQLAAMGRARIDPTQRREFFLYVDEFQNFATDSFATILSEARKYKLGLVLANQYIAQIPEVVADAIFGNVGTMVTFRVGPEDADRLVKQYTPVFETSDLINLPNRQIYVKMAIDGVTSQAFSAHTLPPKGLVTNNAPAIIEQSRRKYSRSRSEVEGGINNAADADYRLPVEKEYDDIRLMRPLILNDTMYKEFSAKGGDRWYFGQPPEVLEEELQKIAAEEAGESILETGAPVESKVAAEGNDSKPVSFELPKAEEPVPAKEEHPLPAPVPAHSTEIIEAPKEPLPVPFEPSAELSSLPQSSQENRGESHEGDNECRKKKRKRKKKNRQQNGDTAEAVHPQPVAVPASPVETAPAHASVVTNSTQPVQESHTYMPASPVIDSSREYETIGVPPLPAPEVMEPVGGHTHQVQEGRGEVGASPAPLPVIEQAAPSVPPQPVQQQADENDWMPLQEL